MGFIQTLKRDITRHRQKTAVLGMLFALMVFMSVRAVFQMHPQSAAALVPEITDPELAAVPSANGAAEADERIRLSKELWRRLRDKRGADVRAAFVFEANYYPPDPTRPIAATLPPETLEQLPIAPKVEDTEISRRNLMLKLREQLLELKVQSTTLGSGKPWAIVNGQLVTIGDTVKGFEITAIRARQIDFRKEGVTSAVNMPDDPRGQ